MVPRRLWGRSWNLKFISKYFQTLSSIKELGGSLWHLPLSMPLISVLMIIKVKVGRWTKRKQFIHKSMCYTFWLALERFKEDMVLEDTMSNHILFAPFALLTRANLRELYMWGEGWLHHTLTHSWHFFTTPRCLGSWPYPNKLVLQLYLCTRCSTCGVVMCCKKTLPKRGMARTEFHPTWEIHMNVDLTMCNHWIQIMFNRWRLSSGSRYGWCGYCSWGT